MRQQTKNILLFIVLMGLCVGVFYGLKWWFAPPPPPPPTEPAAANAALGSLGPLALQEAGKAPPPPQAKPVENPAPPLVVQAAPPPTPPTPLDQLKTTLGDPKPDSPFHLYVQLDPRGACVRRVVLNKFQQADHLGRPANQPEELVPDDPDNPSFLLLAYEINDKSPDARPLDTLGKVVWAVKGPYEEDGAQLVTFTSPPLNELSGLQVTKTFSLRPGEYHVGLKVEVKRLDGDPVAFRYQLTGAHGLPVEGRWYTGVFRNALIGRVEKNKPDYGSRGVERNYQDLHQIAVSEGGDSLPPRDGYFIRYAGVAVQYFASVIVVDDKQVEGQSQDFLATARPTLETACVIKGVIKSVDAGGFVLIRSDGKEQTFIIRQQDRDAEEKATPEDQARFKADGRIPFADLQPNQHLAVVYSSGSYDKALDDKGLYPYPSFAQQLRDESMTQPLWEDDITVRVMTAPADVAKDHSLVHKYLLYNGPVKVMLLDQPDTAAERVAPGLANRYIYDLNLNSMTDYQSAWWIGSITGPTGISWMLIQITNLMHSVLWFLHAYLSVPYILCIICLTLIVRGAMFPVSRKQAMTSMKMMQLQPEMKKLQEKYKDDRQSLAAAQMEMYRKHGVNPFGTCWLLLLQMPIFMGLYYSLQESIHFRLASVSPWWMPNLSAPDMLVWWTPYIWFISQPSWYGWLCYLGPYLNVLPVLAVSLMLVQQKWTMPPPADDQQAQQQKMMKYMMVFMGLMFYKVASGLCIYFIASSLWGFAERRFLPKKKPATADGEPPAEDKPDGGVFSRWLAPKPGNGAGITTGPATGISGKGKRGKRRQESKARDKKDDGNGSMFQRLRAWWADILEQARKK